MQLLSHFVRKHSITILIATVILVVFGIFYGSGVFQNLKKDEGGISVEKSHSLKANNFIKKNFGGDNRQVIVVLKNPNQNINSVEFRNTFRNATQHFASKGAAITSYYSTGAKELKSDDEHSTYAIIEFPNKTDDEIYELVQKQPLKYGDTTVQFGGTLVATKQISHKVEQDLVKAELISLPVLLALLILIFRSFVAATLPVLLGVIAIIGGTSVVRFLAHFIDIDQYAINIITVLGLGLSIDYSLLMVSRFREELDGHDNVSKAIDRTIKSSGRTILFSGLIVMICLSGLVFFPISFLRSVGIGGIAALIVAVLAALIVLPSLLTIIGKNINRGWINKRQQQTITKQQIGRWYSLGKLITGRPYTSIAVAVVIILLCALPLAHVKIKSSGTDYRGLPSGSSSRDVAKSLDQDFHSKTPTLQIVYKKTNTTDTSQSTKDVYDFIRYVKGLDGVEKVENVRPTKPTNLRTGQTSGSFGFQLQQLASFERLYIQNTSTHIKVYTQKDAAAKQTQDIVKQIRSYEPKTGQLLVGGSAAIEYDIRQSVAQRAPLALLIVVVAMTVLLSLLLRSIVIPLQAIVINSFALLSAFGILVWIFQDGHGANLGWFLQTGSLDITIIILIFSITLGLSMDYATFYYSRAREEFDRTKSTNTAILSGLVLTGPVITQAALLLFVVVIAFSTSSIAFLQQVGIGLALAVFIDAFVVRIVLVPAIMQVTGKANWYWPKFLQHIGLRHD